MREELRAVLREMGAGAPLLARLGGLNYINLSSGSILRISRSAMANLKHRGWIESDPARSNPFCQTYGLTDRGREQAHAHQTPVAAGPVVP